MTILLTHPPVARANWYGDSALAALRCLGPVVLNDTGGAFEAGDLVNAAAGCRIMVLDRETVVGPDVMDALPGLVAIVRSGVDIRHIDVAAASDRGVLVTRTEAGYVESTSELVLGHIINAARRIPEYVVAYRQGELQGPLQGVELAGKTVGLIGFGRIARRLAGILDAMEMRVIAYDPFSTVETPARAASLEQVISESDILVPLLAASDTTRGLLGAEHFARMQQGSYLVNCARGDIVDEVALVAALDAGHLAGAAMDVGCAPDNMPTPALAARPDIIATPHIGNLTREAQSRQPFQTVEQARAILAGQMPQNAVNPDRASRLSDLLPAG